MVSKYDSSPYYTEEKRIASYPKSANVMRSQKRTDKLASDLRQIETGFIKNFNERMPASRLKEIQYYFSPLSAGLLFTLTALLIALIFRSTVTTDIATKNFINLLFGNYDKKILKSAVFLIALTAFVVGWRPTSFLRRWVISPMLKTCHHLAMLMAGFGLTIIVTRILIISPEKFFYEVWITGILVFSGLLSAWGARYCHGEVSTVLLEPSIFYRTGLLFIGSITMLSFIP